MRWRLHAALTVLVVLASCGGGEDSSGADAGEKAKADEPEVSVYFVSPTDGATVESPFRVEMAAEGVEVRPAGTMEEGTGHMHILIDTPFIPPGEVIPNDERHLHYGDGSLSATLELDPAEYVLRLQFADGAHRALEGDEYRDLIRVTVQDSDIDESGTAAGQEEESADGSGAQEEGDG